MSDNACPRFDYTTRGLIRKPLNIPLLYTPPLSISFDRHRQSKLSLFLRFLLLITKTAIHY